MGKDKPAAKGKVAPAGKGKGKDEGDKGVKAAKGAQTINIRHILARDCTQRATCLIYLPLLTVCCAV